MPDETEPSTVTVKLSPAVPLLVDVDIELLPPAHKQVGVDFGISLLLMLSNGEEVTNPKGYNAKNRKLRKTQKALSREVKLIKCIRPRGLPFNHDS